MYHDFSNANVGDKVLVKERFSGESVGTILRKTKTMVVITTHKNLEGKPIERRYSLKDGGSIGGTCWDRTYIQPLTEEDRARIQDRHRRANTIDFLTKMNWNKLTTEELSSVKQLIEKLQR